MPEDAGKKRFIKDFLQRVKTGEGFIEDIWIERNVRMPGSSGEGSTAQSLSGRPINNITELLEDDLRHSFDDGYFTFRIVSALKGSGKTSLLTYLHELSKTRSNYEQFSIINRFPLSDITSLGGNQNFSIKLYCYILAETFWKLLTASETLVKDTAKEILNNYLEQNEVNQLITASRLEPFRSKFIRYFSNVSIVFEKFFFEVIHEISKVEPRYTFAYLIDEFDSLEKKPNELQQTISLIRALVKRSAQKFESKIRLFIYVVGTSENIKSLFSEDPVIESLIGHQVINLNTGYENEFEMIKDKINERIKGAFNGYKNFNIAWQNIKNIKLAPVKTLRGFCQEYATEILKIHEKYFKEEPEKTFEGNARALVEAKCRQKWQSYLSQKACILSPVSTTSVINGHAFDCHVNLFHNGDHTASCYGEAKNYELLSSHLKVFVQWLKDVNFKPFKTNDHPPDLAFMIAPSCPPLLRRKLELENIEFIPSSKVGSSRAYPNEEKENSESKSRININAADENLLVDAFKGSRIQRKTIEKIISNRPFQDIDDLVVTMKLTEAAKTKLQAKLNNGEIYF